MNGKEDSLEKALEVMFLVPRVSCLNTGPEGLIERLVGLRLQFRITMMSNYLPESCYHGI